MVEGSVALTQGDALYPGAIGVGDVGGEPPLEQPTLGHVVRAVGVHHVEHVAPRGNKICDLDRKQVKQLPKLTLVKPLLRSYGPGTFSTTESLKTM